MPLLNDKQLKALKPPETGRLELTDTKARGLKFRLTAGGHASWSIQVRIGPDKRRFTIGTYPEIGLSQARAEAERLRAGAKAGVDPIRDAREARRIAEEERLTRQTVEDAISAYAQMHLSDLRTADERERQLRWALGPHLEKAVSDLTRLDFQSAIDAKAKRGRRTSANRIRAALSHFSKWAFERGYMPENIGARTSRAAKEAPRDRVLSVEDVRTIYDVAPELGETWGPLVRLLVLTAQRRSEVAGMRADEIDLDARRWTIPVARSKNAKAHIVHLSPPALAEIARRPASGLLFSTTGTTPVSGFGKMKVRLDKLLGLSDWRLHDLRTAFASALCEAGEPESTVDRVLNHSAVGSAPSAVARVYNRSQQLAQRAAVLDRWAEMVTGERGKVVEMRA